MVDKIPFTDTGAKATHIAKKGREVLRRAGEAYFIKARRKKGGRWETVGTASTAEKGKVDAKNFLRNCFGYLEAFVEDARTGNRVRNSLQTQVLTVPEDDA